MKLPHIKLQRTIKTENVCTMELTAENILASLPFWIIGGFLLIVAVVGTVVTTRDIDTIDDAKLKKAFYSAGSLYLMSGAFLLLAAKICS